MQDHGGDLDRARALYGGSDWLDLSTGINAAPYPLPEIPARIFSALPMAEDIRTLETIAAAAYGTRAQTVALAGAQAAIQLVPQLRARGRAAVLAPSYNEHGAALRAQGWFVEEEHHPEDMAGADLAVVVNPNNPDGRTWPPAVLAGLAERVGFLVVDESFADPHPEVSLAPMLDRLGERVLVMRSFGKFFGLAGLRLGFALSGAETAARLRALAGPWSVSGPAIAAGRTALVDHGWREATVRRLTHDATRLDRLASEVGWHPVGGTALFRTFDTKDAAWAQERLARAAIWSRRFAYSPTWLRLGLPGSDIAWSRLSQALAGSCK